MKLEWMSKYVKKVNGEVIKRNQKKLLMVSISGVMLFFVLSITLTGNGNMPVKVSSAKKEKIQLVNLTRGAKAEDRWIQQSERELSQLKEELKQEKARRTRLEKEFKQKMVELEKQSLKAENLEELKIGDQTLAEVLKELNDYNKERVNRNSSSSSVSPISHPTSHSISRGGVGSSAYVQQYTNQSANQGINSGTNKEGNSGSSQGSNQLIHQKIGVLELSESDVVKQSKLNSFAVKEYLPAGSYVSARVMSGVDASVGIKSQANPRPVLFRITEEAKNAWFKDHQKTNLKGCVVTGAAEGDLSSERVFVNLVRMSCSHEDGRVIETEVKGYVVSQGKAGVRGKVVSREGDFITKSFLAGVVGGLGGGASQYFTTPASATSAGLLTQRPVAGDVLGQGLGKGVGSASDRLSKYLIDRAEQYQPVISIPSGLEVELVFHKGVYIDGRKKS